METKEDVFNALLESWEGYFAEYIAEHDDPDKTNEIIDPQKDEFIRRWKNAI